MNHTALLTEPHTQTNESDVFKRALGQFYTPPFIYKNLINSTFLAFRGTSCDEFSVVDPFCGDGRLLVEFIKHAQQLPNLAGSHWKIAFWDFDPRAVNIANDQIQSLVDKFCLKATLYPSVQDSFLASSTHYGLYDLVLTNPPWEAIKPDSRELKNLDYEQQKEYRHQLKLYDARIKMILPHSQPSIKYAGWGTNLSRCGTEVAVNLTKENGLCGLVTPLSLLTDQTSVQLRDWILQQACFQFIDYYPAETKLFTGVDQESVAFVLKKSPEQRFNVTINHYTKEEVLRKQVNLDIRLEKIKQLQFCIPVQLTNPTLEILNNWSSLKTIGEIESLEKLLWLGRELDETRYEEFLSNIGKHLFLKGRMVGRYKLLEQPAKYVREDLRKIPESALYHRVAWRDVSRRSQERRMQAAIVLPGYVTGNSLHVAYWKDNDLDKSKILLAYMNSIPFECQVRNRLGTGHISLGVVRQVRVPSFENKKLIALLLEYIERLKGEDSNSAEIALEVIVAQAYGLDREKYKTILEHFCSLSDEMKQQLISHDLWYDQAIKEVTHTV